ncbi:MFS transporter [Mycobacteroides abscessus]|uniref:MFS transporter n=1 Tax=Mycobacteroides abscessus TaxID=36809 RepID=UPI000929D84E|nr:MFS transporter [Mycobacteroides abscessus]MDO3334698.1 MFS transporter [Mycobacteroides abscessus subsp. bolletii]QSM91178.1 MFS transporter [Mycobacteroides abscessus subsp. bolletii]SIC85255.1 MFS family transporter [Mycobacteroides abscessus subsp. bolletii]SIJ96502.1 Putative MFS transporter [Mycobacteroides abscessus subsp. bolletii]SIJ99316.1 Putative MFS transporter [Mycobacteroides abscessus subsp. bolletii]
MTATLRDETHMISAAALRRGRLMVLAAILLFALCLRSAVTSLSPLLTQISHEIGFGSAVIGVFGMLPTAMFAVAGLVTPALTERFGLERTTLAAVVATVIGMAARAAMNSTGGLLVLSCLALLGMGIGNVVIPPLVKRYFSHRVALMSAAYLTVLQIGTTVPALTAVPLADAYGWRFSLVAWVLVPVAALLPWIGVVIARRGHDVADHSAEPHADSAAVGQVWRSPLAWGMAGMFGMTSLVTYSMFTWIPAILASAGGSAKLGGVMVALFSAVGFVGTLAIPPLAARMSNPFPLVAACLVCFLIGFAGLLWLPMYGTAVWVVALGFGPSTFPLGLTLVNLRTRTPAGSAALSGFTQGVGYAVACLGPLLFGVLHDVSGGWHAPFGLLLVAITVLGVGAFQACKPRILEDTWNRDSEAVVSS